MKLVFGSCGLIASLMVLVAAGVMAHDGSLGWAGGWIGGLSFALLMQPEKGRVWERGGGLSEEDDCA